MLQVQPPQQRRINKLITHPPPPSNRRTRVRITVAPSKSALPPYFYRIMPPLNKRKKSIKEVTKERERQRKIRKMQEERGWESSEEEVEDAPPQHSELPRATVRRYRFRIKKTTMTWFRWTLSTRMARLVTFTPLEVSKRRVSLRCSGRRVLRTRDATLSLSMGIES